jgi:subtilisin
MRLQKKWFAPFFTLALVASVTSAQTVNNTPKSSVVPGHYIVVLKDAVADSDTVADDIGRVHGFAVDLKYSRVMKGFAATFEAGKLKNIKDDPRVAYVVEDREVTINDKAASGPVSQVFPTTQVVPTGISRIGAPANTNKGAGVGIAIIDTGIDLTHPDLKDNIGGAGKTCVTGTRNANDDNGHGTHVAGTIAAADNTIGVVGVAPKAKLFPVKVLNKSGSGTWSSVICGIDWVTANAAKYGIKVANMSLGGAGTSDNNCGLTNNDPLHQAICRSTAAGVTYVVAAGNDGANATNSTPASYNDTVITVSALADSNGIGGGTGSATSYGADDTFATFSNYGSPVDIAAPGVLILSTWKGGTYNTISGTSMATPHVTGAAALYLASHPGSLWTQVRDALVAAGEALGAGHTDPSGLHAEPVLQARAL